MVENMPAVVFAKDSATGRFVLLNRAGEEFLGVPRAAIIGKTDHDFFPKEEADRFIARDPPRAPVAPAASGRGGAGPYPA